MIMNTQQTHAEVLVDIVEQHKSWLKSCQLYEFFTLDNKHYDIILTPDPVAMANELSRDWGVHVEEVSYEIARDN